jgi:hypothetical protein
MAELNYRLVPLTIELDGCPVTGSVYAIVDTRTNRVVETTTSASRAAGLMRRLVDADLIRQGKTPTRHYPQPTKRGQHHARP